MKDPDNLSLMVDQLTVSYDKTAVLWDIHLEIPEGLMVGIICPNGAGKSTLSKRLIGMEKPLSGIIEFFGKPFKSVRNRIAYIPQRSSVDWDFPISAFDLVLMGRFGKLGYFKRPKSADREAVYRVLDMVGMLEFAERQISQLSGGQQQRLFIARALLQDADLYLMDEPFSGVDMATEKAIVAMMEEIKAKGKTVFVVHHDLGTVDAYFDWVIMLNTCVIASGSVSDVFNKDAIMRTYGRGSHLLDEAIKLTQNKSSGLDL